MEKAFQFAGSRVVSGRSRRDGGSSIRDMHRNMQARTGADRPGTGDHYRPADACAYNFPYMSPHQGSGSQPGESNGLPR